MHDLVWGYKAGKPIALVNPITPTDQETQKCGLIEANADLKQPSLV